jgi:hypothetical protein
MSPKVWISPVSMCAQLRHPSVSAGTQSKESASSPYGRLLYSKLMGGKVGGCMTWHSAKSVSLLARRSKKL